MTKMILLIEPDSSIAKVLTEILNEEHFLVKHVENTSEAKKVLSIGTPDIIICEELLKGAAGSSFRKELLAHEKLSWIPFVLTSGNLRRSEVDLDSAAFFLQKPYSIADLLAIVRLKDPSIS